MPAYANRVWMSTATTGTGTITLGTAQTGYITFAQGGIANASSVTYTIIDGNNFEVGRGTYTSSGTTLSRDTVLVSLISGTSGTTTFFVWHNRITHARCASVVYKHRGTGTFYVKGRAVWYTFITLSCGCWHILFPSIFQT